jgi:hypothetical protein
MLFKSFLFLNLGGLGSKLLNFDCPSSLIPPVLLCEIQNFSCVAHAFLEASGFIWSEITVDQGEDASVCALIHLHFVESGAD